MILIFVAGDYVKANFVHMQYPALAHAVTNELHAKLYSVLINFDGTSSEYLLPGNRRDAFAAVVFPPNPFLSCDS